VQGESQRLFAASLEAISSRRVGDAGHICNFVVPRSVSATIIIRTIPVSFPPDRLPLNSRFEGAVLPTMNFDKKDEDSGALFHLDKTQVFQDARAFNASPIQPKKCRIILTKIKCTPISSYPALVCVTLTVRQGLLDSGEVWSTREATDLFFGITKLFQHRDVCASDGAIELTCRLHCDRWCTLSSRIFPASPRTQS